MTGTEELNAKINDDIIKIIEDDDWWIGTPREQDGKYYVDLGFLTDLGEDFSVTIWFDGTESGFVAGLVTACAQYDADEHAELWVANREKMHIPGSVIDIAKDALAIADELDRLTQDVVSAYKRGGGQ